jgi:hypothetical protein
MYILFLSRNIFIKEKKNPKSTAISTAPKRNGERIKIILSGFKEALSWQLHLRICYLL